MLANIPSRLLPGPVLRRAALLAAFAVAALHAAPARADHERQAEITKQLATKAADLLRSTNKEAAKAAYLNSPDFHVNDAQFNGHICALDMAGTIWADGSFPELIGLDFRDVSDLDGVSVGSTVLDGIAKSPAGFPSTHRFSNSVTKKVAHTEGYCLRVKDEIVCAYSQEN